MQLRPPRDLIKYSHMNRVHTASPTAGTEMRKGNWPAERVPVGIDIMIVEFSIVPIGAGTSLSPFVAECLRIVQESGLKHQLTPMGTVVQGDGAEVMAVVMRCHDRVLQMSERVVTSIKIDDRRDRGSDMERKVSSVMEKVKEG